MSLGLKKSNKKYVRYSSKAEVNDIVGYAHPENRKYMNHRRREIYDHNTRVPFPPAKNTELVQQYGDPYYIQCHNIDRTINTGGHNCRTTHPVHSSRFGYPGFSNGYGVGNVYGHIAQHSTKLGPDPQPQGVAPAKFYTKNYQIPWKHTEVIYISQ